MEETAKDLLGKMLEKEHENRPTIEEVLKHPYFEDFSERTEELRTAVENDFTGLMSEEEKKVREIKSKFNLAIDEKQTKIEKELVATGKQEDPEAIKEAREKAKLT